MSPLDFNPFSSLFDGSADNNLFFAGNNHHHRMNSSSFAQHPCSGLRLQRETQEAYIYVVDAPAGMKSEDLQMTLERNSRNDTVMIQNVRDDDVRAKEFRNNNVTKSSSSTKFHRLLSLRSNVDAERISAFVINGVLTITVPKLSPQQGGRATPTNDFCGVQMTSLTARA
mmetsp:Transcript_43109/g.104329  ORF Transcript_43109/g.104329 Transcript_43109/m.104329 type:complete len:170 (-) Transcript_43109:96-605(-)